MRVSLLAGIEVLRELLLSLKSLRESDHKAELLPASESTIS
jgi:hypothetical protein